MKIYHPPKDIEVFRIYARQGNNSKMITVIDTNLEDCYTEITDYLKTYKIKIDNTVKPKKCQLSIIRSIGVNKKESKGHMIYYMDYLECIDIIKKYLESKE